LVAVVFVTVHHGSMGSQPVPAVLRRTKGNIGAIMFLKPLWFFRRSGPDQKMMLAIPRP
jgi:hypothetical protein